MEMTLDGPSFISPNPTRFRSMFTILKPLSQEVWLGLCLAFFAVAFVMYSISAREERIVTVNLREWSR